MFGKVNNFLKRVRARFGSKPVDADNQIPYQVYETVHEPAARRKRWAVRLVVALAAVTVAVVGFIWMRSDDTANTDRPNGPEQAVQQAPQNNPGNPALDTPAGEPGSTPSSDSDNNQTVPQPI